MRWALLLSLLLWPLPAQADDIVVCDPTDALVPNRVVQYDRSADPVKSGALTNANALIWSLPASSVRPWSGLPPALGTRYWKCVDTNADSVLDDVVSMSSAEQSALDAPSAAEAALQQNYTDEIAANDLCTGTLAEFITRIDAEQTAIQTAIDASSNLAQAKAAMTTMNTKLAAAFKKVAKCIRARAR